MIRGKQFSVFFVSLLLLAISPLASASESQAATYQKGYQAYKADDYGRAMQIFKPLAKSGYVPAQYYVGKLHEKGLGVPEDLAEALKWYRHAAEGGHAKSQYKLGYSYWKGLGGLKRNDAEAGKWFMKAAKQGYRKGQQAVAKGYKKGMFGFPKDRKKAAYWTEQADK